MYSIYHAIGRNLFKNIHLFQFNTVLTISSIPEKISNIQIGQLANVEKKFSSNDIQKFAQLTGDYNPVHFNAEILEKYNFPKNIVHGALINGVISATIGTILPGPGSILLEQELRFPNPYESFVTTVKIANKKRNIYFCEYKCVTISGKKVTEGMAKIMFNPVNSVKH